jgi:hypothetical protein
MAALYAKTANAQIRDRVRALPELGPAPPVDINSRRKAAGSQ